MKFLKITSVLILSAVFFSAFIPEASARYGCKRRSSFGMSFNVGGPGYVVAPAPVVAAPVVVAPAVVPVAPAPVVYGYGYGYNTYVAPAPYPYYYTAPAPVVVQRPAYVQPSTGFSFSFRR